MRSDIKIRDTALHAIMVTTMAGAREFAMVNILGSYKHKQLAKERKEEEVRPLLQLTLLSLAAKRL
jgi:hypothetical protein